MTQFDEHSLYKDNYCMKLFRTDSNIFYCILLAFFPLFTFLQMSVLNVLSADIINTLKASSTWVDLLGAAYLYADALMLLPAGILLDRYNTKSLVIYSLLLNLVGLFIFTLANTLWVAIIGRVIAGFGHAFALLSCFRLAKTLLPLDKQGFVMGIVFTLALSGGFIAQVPIAILLSYIGFTHTLYLLIMFGLLILLGIALLLPKKITQPAFIEHNNLMQNLKLISRNSQNWFAAIYSCLMSMPLMILGTLWGIEYLVKTHQLTSHTAAIATGLLFFGNIIGLPLAGWISDRLANRKLIMEYGAVLTFIVLLIIHACSFHQIHSLMTLFFLIGLLSGTLILSYPIIAEINPVEMISTAMGFMSVLIVTLTASLQVIFGIIQIHINQYSFLMIVGCILMSFITSLAVKKAH